MVREASVGFGVDAVELQSEFMKQVPRNPSLSTIALIHNDADVLERDSNQFA